VTAKKSASSVYRCRCCARLVAVLRAAGTEPVPLSTLFKLLGGCEVEVPSNRAREKLGRLECAAARDGSAKVVGFAAGYRRALLDLRRLV